MEGIAVDGFTDGRSVAAFLLIILWLAFPLVYFQGNPVISNVPGKFRVLFPGNVILSNVVSHGLNHSAYRVVQIY